MTGHEIIQRPIPTSKPSVSGLVTLGLAVSLPVLVWAVIPPQRAGDDYAVGPYHLNVVLERVVGVFALIVLLASGVAAFRGRRTPNAIGVGAAAFVWSTTSLCAAGWRVVTAGGDGANIGGGGVLLCGPVLVAGLLVTAVTLQLSYRRMPRLQAAVLLAAATALAPALYWLLDYTISKY